MNAWPYPKLFAHRGGGTLAPENTLAGMKVAADHLYTAVEFDVKLSADGVAFLMHDDMLERTTNGTGAFKDKTAAEIELLDASGWMTHFLHAESFEQVPRLTAVMSYLHTHGMNANIEIKPCVGREAETGQAVAILVEEITRAQTLKPLLSSFSVEALRHAHQAAPHLPMALLVEAYLPAHDALLAELGSVSLNCNEANINRQIVEHLHARDTRVMVYTVNDEARAAALFQLGVDGIFTDNLAAMAKQFPRGLLAH
jgi:glycerophosphoryl diester phosphodiesterase